MWTAVGLVAAIYLFAVGMALLLWPQRLLEAAGRLDRRDGPSSRPSKRPDAAERPESVDAMRAVGVIAVGAAGMLAFVLLR